MGWGLGASGSLVFAKSHWKNLLHPAPTDSLYSSEARIQVEGQLLVQPSLFTNGEIKRRKQMI